MLRKIEVIETSCIDSVSHDVYRFTSKAENDNIKIISINGIYDNLNKRTITYILYEKIN